jgi:hypothetical protein
MNSKIAIIIISHNAKDITTNLCNQIIKYTKSRYDLLVVETGSRKKELTDFPTLWLPDGIRATRGFNWGIDWFLFKESFDNDLVYDSFWMLVNDTIHPNYDVLTPMINFMNNNSDCGEIHPYIENSPSKFLHKTNSGLARKVSFCEFVCPLFSRKAIDYPPKGLFDNRFFYFWGIDYDLPKILHDINLRLYISNEVGIIHNAGTTTKLGADEDFKTMTDQFNVSRDNMIQGLKEKYGEKWYKVIYDSIPPDVSKSAYMDWIVNIGQNCKIEDLL